MLRRYWCTLIPVPHLADLRRYWPLRDRRIQPAGSRDALHRPRSAELDCDNLPDAMIPGVGPSWERVPWSGNARGRNTTSFQYTGEDGTRYQVIVGQSRDDDNGEWYDDRLYLNDSGIEMFKAFGKAAPKAQQSRWQHQQKTQFRRRAQSIKPTPCAPVR